MAKKPTKAAPKKPASDVDHHRQRAREYRAKAQLHDAKASMMEAKNPPKKPSGGYPY